MKCIRRRRVGAMLALQAAVVAGASQVWAGITFDSTNSTVTITHDADVGAADGLYVVRPKVPATSSLATSAPQINHTFGSVDLANSIATGSLGQTTNATTATFVLATGTGISQTDPGGANYPGSSSLKFDIDLWWNVTSPGFGPLANGYSSLAVGGTVGTGGSASVRVKLDWLNANGATLRGGIDTTHNYQAGPFAETITTSKVLGSGSVPAGKLHVTGFVEFLANNDGGPSNMNQVRGEFGGAPPTAHFRMDASGSYFQSENWEFVPEGEDGLRSIANAAGDRAVFFSTTGEKTSHSVSIGSSVTLGTLDVGGEGAYQFTNGDSGHFNFVTQPGAGNAVINSRGRGLGNAISVPIDVNTPLDVVTDERAPLGFLSTVNGTSPINKFGPGSAVFLASNSNFAGGLNVMDGVARGSALRSLGIGQVVVDGGELQYAFGGASAQPVMVKTGLLNLEAVSTEDHFEIQDGGAIGGTPSVVSSLTVGQQLALRSGAMIVHNDPENTQAGNPQNLGNDPLYIYGVSGSVPAADLAVGSASGTPWVGIGGSRGTNTIGDPASTVNVLGSAVISSLPSGSLDVQSKLVGGGGTLNKNGAGIVRLSNDNTYTGPTNVNAGAMLINGSLASNVTVKSGGTAGGTGFLIGLLVASEDGSAVSPGDGGTGKLSVRQLVLGQNTELDFDLDTPATSDELLVAGDLVLDGQLFINVADNIAAGRYPIMHFGGNLQNNGLQIASAPAGLHFEIVVDQNEGGGEGGFVLSDNDAHGGTVYLVVVPEPSIVAMMGIGLVGLMRRRRR